MKIYVYQGLLCLLFVFSSCSLDTKESHKLKTKLSPKTRVVADTSAQHSISPEYQAMFPDTSKLFSDIKDLGDYASSRQNLFYKTPGPTGQTLGADYSDQAVFLKEQFSAAAGTLIFKNIKHLPRTKTSMILLIAHRNHPDISIEDRLSVFETFPTELKKSEAGKKTFHYLSEYLFVKNLGFNFSAIGDVELFIENSEKKQLISILNHSGKFTLISFGASWCKPCIIQEEQLKKIYSKIDSSGIKIVGISIDEKHDKFSDYLKKHRFPWSSYRIDGEFKNPIFKRLEVGGVPRNFLLDDSGKVIREDEDVFKILSWVFKDQTVKTL